MILGADISDNQWRRGLPFHARKAMLAEGLRFLFARASIGLEPDKAFPVTRARSAPFDLFGGYHYLVADVDPAAQADLFISRFHNTGTVAGAAAVLDVEDDRTGAIHNIVSLFEVRAWVKAWRTIHPNVPLGLYSNRSTWARLGNPSLESIGFDYAWNAYYPNDTPPPFPAQPPMAFGGAGAAPLWQYGPVHVAYSGHHVSIDGDAFYGTLDELKALAANRPAPPDRSVYITAHNGELTDLVSTVEARPAPAPTASAQWIKGVEDARTEAIAALRALKIGGTN
jgi:Glycosyl hydrolases family 25